MFDCASGRRYPYPGLDVRGQAVRILLVEDDDDDAFVVQRALGKSDDPVVVFTRFARLGEALPVLMRGDVDVVMLDLKLPDSAGIPTVERTHVIARHIPIIVLSGVDEDDLGLACIEAGASDFVSKSSVSPHALRRTLAFALERHRQREVRQLEDALGRYRQLLEVAGEPEAELPDEAPLSRRNPRLLEVLSEHYREVVDAYVAHLVERTPKPNEAITSIATSFGELNATPDDLIDCHVRAVESALAEAPQERRQPYASAGRMMALDMMSSLVEFYRTGGSTGGAAGQ